MSAGTPLSGNSMIVDTADSVSAVEAARTDHDQGGSLSSWVIEKIKNWENQRNRGYQKLWAEYWRLWRGKYADEDKNRQSERSRLIAPALAQAIESAVSEIEEALFSRDVWFDVDDRTDEKARLDALLARDFLLDDFDKANVRDALSEAILNGAIFGTGIVQVNVQVVKDDRPSRNPQTMKLEAKGKDRVLVTVESIRPDEFIPDPSGKNIQEMLGCAISRVRPVHTILEKIEQGLYRKEALDMVRAVQRVRNYDIDQEDPQSNQSVAESDDMTVVEYHGKVPLSLLNETKAAKTALDAILDHDSRRNDDGVLVEAIVTIANDSVLLRAIPNPFVMKDRAIIAFQFQKVPGRFWGRGVAEQGYNPQKALDATVRAYIDALGYVSAPMLGIDSGRIPRGFKMDIKPGKVWLTQGSPNDVLQPVKIGELDPALFQQASEMERMVQMGTGSFDTASALKNQSQSGASGLSSNSMFMGAFVKRAKRAIQNVDRNLVTPVVVKSMWRYAQFDPTRYPQVFDFDVKSTLGIMAREVEAMQQTQLIGMMPDEFAQVKVALAQGIIENSAVSNKAQILKMIAQALQPPSPEQQKAQQDQQQMQQAVLHAEAEGKLLDNQLKIAQIRETLARAAMEGVKGQVSVQQVQQEQQRIALQQQDINNFADQNRIAHARLFIDNKKADAALISAHKKPSGASSN